MFPPFSPPLLLCLYALLPKAALKPQADKAVETMMDIIFNMRPPYPVRSKLGMCLGGIFLQVGVALLGKVMNGLCDAAVKTKEDHTQLPLRL